jgi:chromosome condensin MukBEF MukE localization factor
MFIELKALQGFFEIYSTSKAPTNGSIASDLALLIDKVSCLWCLAQAPEIRLGMILPRSVVKYFNAAGSL